MPVTLFRCGPSANESEETCFVKLEEGLRSRGGDDQWTLLANLNFSSRDDRQSDEIDLIAIGPPGVRVIEIKHWSAEWVAQNTLLVEREADKLTNKARKIATTLRGVYGDLGFVDQAFILTRENSDIAALKGKLVRGVPFHSLTDWQAAINLDGSPNLDPVHIKVLTDRLEPRSAVAMDGSLRRFAGFNNLELQSPKTELFHRVYKGVKTLNRDRGILHLYDLSASDQQNAENIARREFDTLKLLSQTSWTPQVLDSYQAAPGYDGDMYFFSIVDPEAPSIEKRSGDTGWTSQSRIALARGAVSALAELHGIQVGESPNTTPLVHRNLSPETVLVKHDDSPLLTGLHLARIADMMSVGGVAAPAGTSTAPEISADGLGAATTRSDIFSLSHSLSGLFQDREDDVSQQALDVLRKGCLREPGQRATLEELRDSLSRLLGESVPVPQPPSHQYWSEGQKVPFHGKTYRIIVGLGAGGIGRTWKVELLDTQTQEPTGNIYVAKVASNREDGERVLRSYALARPNFQHQSLSTIFEYADRWEENGFTALMTWIEGDPFDDLRGLIQEMDSPQDIVIWWLRGICEGLASIHSKNLIHGDISPKNLLVSPGMDDLRLTDYDFVCRVGEQISGPGTYLYSPLRAEGNQLASKADDIFALAASFFSVLFERSPFEFDGEVDKSRGLNWDGIDPEIFPLVSPFLARATDPDPSKRFPDVEDALAALTASTEERPQPPPKPPEFHEGTVERLKSLLESYPGSRKGNKETRGLDTAFASDTYVPTLLEKELLKDIKEHRVQLVLLCGNAGDGKTALLQHIASEVGLGETQSSDRILEGSVEGGPYVRMNLDGSASWNSRSADSILDEFLKHFQEGPSQENIIHFLAINDGRLLEWIAKVEDERGGAATPLTEGLTSLLLDLPQDDSSLTSHVRFVNLNDRSLVGNINTEQHRIDTSFLDNLIDRFYGGSRAGETWEACRSCSAKDHCQVYKTAAIFAPDGHPAMDHSDRRQRARQRLFDTLQAVHLSGETHITMRELRSALVYILFGMHTCDEYHSGEANSQPGYWDLTFDPESPNRQGDLLRSLSRLDPALEASPKIDRRLQTAYADDQPEGASAYPLLGLRSARRRAFFEWSENDIIQVAQGRDNLHIARGRHLLAFRDLGISSDNSAMCESLCRGIARLEDLPPIALQRPGAVALRITPKTPTETAFWVEKPLGSFELRTDLTDISLTEDSVERLHRQAILVYHYDDGREELLYLGSELFHVLLELARGYQLGDVSSEDNFAHLSIFVRRLLRDDNGELFAWNPKDEDKIYRVSGEMRRNANPPIQPLMIEPVMEAD